MRRCELWRFSSVSKTSSGTLYRGHEGMWSWVGHRVTGVVIFLYLLVHVLDTSLVRVDADAYNSVISTYQTWYMALGETALVAAIIFHALNGLRLILVDFWKQGTKYQRQMLWGVLILWVIVLAAFAIRHLSIAFGGH